MRWPALITVLVAAPGLASAEPRTSAFVDDPQSQEAGTLELGTNFEYRGSDVSALDEGVYYFELRPAIGLERWPVELAPSFRLRQRASEETLMDTIGVELRAPMVIGSSQMSFVATLGYAASLDHDFEQRLLQSVSADSRTGRFTVIGELTIQEGIGAEEGTRAELRLGAALFMSLLRDDALAIGLEGLYLTPLAGQRMSDHPFGALGEKRAWYAGPSLAVRGKLVWASIGSLIGILDEASTDLMVRVNMGLLL